MIFSPESSKIISPKSITLDSSGLRISIKLEFNDSVEDGKIKIDTEPGILTVQSQSNGSNYYTGFPETGKFHFNLRIKF